MMSRLQATWGAKARWLLLPCALGLAARVRLRPAPSALCYDMPPCFLAVVLDAAPDAP
jgi:hypothetical protein